MESKYALNTPVALAQTTSYDDNFADHSLIMRTDNGAIILVAIKKGNGMQTHLAPDDVMIQVVEGKVVFTVDGEKKTLNQGDFFLMAKDTPHAVKALEDTKFLLTKIKP